MDTKFWLESFKGRNFLEDLGVGEMILGCGYVNRVHLVRDDLGIGEMILGCGYVNRVHLVQDRDNGDLI
jgi:hypothetical protein